MQDELSESLVVAYLQALKSEFEVRLHDGVRVIIAPFYRPDRDYLEIELSLDQDGNIVLTDNSDTINFLFVRGLSVDQEELRKTMSLISATYGAEVIRDEIRVTAPVDCGGLALRAFLDTAMALSHLVYRRRLITPQLLRGRRFDSLVRKFLEGKRIPHSSVELEGNFMTHRFSFYVNTTRKMIIQPVSARDEKDALRNAMILGFEWLDIKEKHPVYQKVAFIEDSGRKESYWEDPSLRILERLSDTVFRWSKREEILAIL